MGRRFCFSRKEATDVEAKWTKWVTPEGLDKIKGWALDGLSDAQIRDKDHLGVCQQTFYTWKKEHPEIAEALRMGKEVADRRVENAVYKSARGYYVDEVTTFTREAKTSKGEPLLDGDGEPMKSVETKVVKKWIPSNATAAIFWLKHRKPVEWGDY